MKELYGTLGAVVLAYAMGYCRGFNSYRRWRRRVRARHLPPEDSTR